MDLVCVPVADVELASLVGDDVQAARDAMADVVGWQESVPTSGLMSVAQRQLGSKVTCGR